MSKVIFTFILVVVWFTTAYSNFLKGSNTILISDEIANEEVLRKTQNIEDITRFFVVGDFGDPNSIDDLDKVTDLMNDFSKQEKYDFIATVGDNVYESGIESMQKLETVELVMKTFKRDSLRFLPMFLTLGNHDWASDYKNEIEYSNYDSQWNIESDYYELKVPMKDDPSKFLVLLMANSCKLDCLTEFKETNKQSDCDDMNVKVGGSKVREHYTWLENKLSNYSADESVSWLGIVMHHPFLLEPNLKKDLIPLLQKYRVDFGILGHKHSFEYANIDYDADIKYPNSEYGDIIDDWDGKKTHEILNTPDRSQIFKKGEKLHQFLVGGSGRKLKDLWPYLEQDGDVYFQNSHKHGFITVNINSKTFSTQYYNHEKTLIYEVTIQN